MSKMTTATSEVLNLYHVGKSQWKKWNDDERRRFNYMYDYVVNNQHLFKHPLDGLSSAEYWKTTAWNVAWIAADYDRWLRKHEVN